MRPVDPDLVADLAAQQRVARDIERLGLDVEKRVLDGAERLADDAALPGTRRIEEVLADQFMVHRALADHAVLELVDYRGDARRAEALVELAPADDAILGGDLEEEVVPPAVAAREGLEVADDLLSGHVLFSTIWWVELAQARAEAATDNGKPVSCAARFAQPHGPAGEIWEPMAAGVHVARSHTETTSGLRRSARRRP